METYHQIELEAESISEEDIQDWLAERIAEQLGIDAEEIDYRLPFDRYGLDSVQAMNIAGLGKKYFGLNLSPLIIWSYPNIETLSRYMVKELEASEMETFEI